MTKETTKVSAYESDLRKFNMIRAKFGTTQPELFKVIMKVMTKFKPEIAEEFK